MRNWLLTLAGVILLGGGWTYLASHSAPSYNAEFFSEMDRSAMMSATAVVHEINGLLHPQSAVDIGSGNGSWSKAMLDAGIPDVIAVDGPWVDKTKLKVPPSRFVVRDLVQPLRLDRTFDLVLCLETAEHLPATRADSLVADLVKLAPAVVFSAAIPGQGGTMHINEQWQTYWAERFAKQGYTAVDILRPRLWSNEKVSPMYRQNMILYVRPEYLANREHLREWSHSPTHSGAVMSMVHPAVFQQAQRDAIQQTRWQSKVKKALGLSQ